MATSKHDSLLELKAALEEIFRRELSTQGELATLARVDQSTVSRALYGKMKRYTPTADLLMNTCQSVLAQPEKSQRVVRELHRFYARKGTEEELIAVIALGTTFVETFRKTE